MIQAIKSYFSFASNKPTTEFSVFFTTAKSSERKKFFKEVIRKANQDQLDLVRKYDSQHSKAK
jgi:hypothetical protein